jgi:glycosyltransferase involved in cell wall biosynthesis
MRVLVVNAHGADPGYGGAERYVRDIALGLRGRGNEAIVLSAFPPRESIDVETLVLHRSDWRDDRIRRIRNHAGDTISAPGRRLTAVLERTRPELVHTSNLSGIGSGIWEAARRLGIPVVHTIHDYHLLCPRTTLTRRDGTPCEPSPLLCGLRTRRLARWAGAVRQLIAGSEHLLRAHNGIFGAARQHLIRLPLAPAAEGPVAAPRTPPATLGYIGALTATKGVELLLAAAPGLASHGIAVQIAGEGPLRERVAESEARYMGRVDGSAKADFLASCDLGVVPSLWEEPSGPPYVVREWQAAGRPVLSTRRGGLAEAAPGPGVVAFDESPEALVEATLRLCEPQEWLRVRATIPAVEGDADVRRWLDQHLAVYEMALEGTASPARS